MKHFKLHRGELTGVALGSIPTHSRLDSLSLVSRQSVLGILLVFLTLFSGNAWATSYVSYNGDTEDKSTTISASNVSNGSAGKVSWTGSGCSYSDNRVNISADGYIEFTVTTGFQITKVVITSGSTTDFYGTWTATSGTKSVSGGTTTFSDINALSVRVTTSTAFRCTKASTIKIYYVAATKPGGC